MTAFPCPECGHPMPEGIDCHHHNTTETVDLDQIIVSCEDCPAWWTENRVIEP